MKKIFRYFLEKIKYFLAGLLAVGTLAVIANNINLATGGVASNYALVMEEIEALSFECSSDINSSGGMTTSCIDRHTSNYGNENHLYCGEFNGSCTYNSNGTGS
jgi:hypothetical protein